MNQMERLRELIQHNYVLVNGGRITGKATMLKEVSQEMKDIMDSIPVFDPRRYVDQQQHDASEVSW